MSRLGIIAAAMCIHAHDNWTSEPFEWPTRRRHRRRHRDRPNEYPKSKATKRRRARNRMAAKSRRRNRS